MDILPNGSFALSGFLLIATLSKGYAIVSSGFFAH